MNVANQLTNQSTTVTFPRRRVKFYSWPTFVARLSTQSLQWVNHP